ncbi:MFS general substrate transporter [Xylariaceae sp. FL0255]|nr:MFS general substrate transporter [Xylariaceae sp. FL0255]
MGSSSELERVPTVGDEKRSHTPPGDSHAAYHDSKILEEDYEGKPTDEELKTLRRVPGKLPITAYLICTVEFCERASYYGVQPLITNYVNRPLPIGGDGYGAPPRGTQQTAGALGLGEVTANATSQSFSFLAYSLPLFFGWLSDSRTGRFRLICWGVGVFGVAHVLLIASGAKNLLANGTAKIPFFLAIYILSIGAAMFKPNVSPLLLDQITTTVPKVITLKSGERVIEDPEATTERVMLWFYLLINVGGFFGVATAYAEKYVGWYLAFLLPLLVYLPLPALLWYLKSRLILHPPGGSDLPDVFRVLGVVFRRGGIKRIGRHGFWDLAKPSHIAAAGVNIKTSWNDEFVDDVRRAFQATGMFCFFPIQSLNDNGIGAAANYLTTGMTTNGVPNDVISNVNSLAIIAFAPILNYGLYPLLRKWNIHYGAVARITTGILLSAVGGVGYTVLQYYVYKESPCGYYATSNCEDGFGVAPITIWYTAIPYGIGGISELFINVPAYGIAYSMAPVNMRGVVSAINLFNQAITYIIGLATSSVIRDPFLIWDFGGPAIAGFVVGIFFYFYFRHLDRAEYIMKQAGNEYEIDATGTISVVGETDLNRSVNRPAPIAENEEMMISQKQ